MTARRIVVPARFNGPPGSANGGWVAGALAQHLDAGPDVPAAVSLLAPPPLDVELAVVRTDGGVELHHDEVVLARAEVVPACAEVVPARAAPVAADSADPAVRAWADTPAGAAGFGDAVPAAPSRDEAAAGRAHFLEFTGHPFTGCFVCGTARSDGLGVFPGPVVPGDWTRVACSFATTEFAGVPELLWGALDCPSGWAAGLATNAALLARYTVAVLGAPEPGEPCRLVGTDDGPRGTSGRARGGRSAAYGADGRLLGRASAVWIAPRHP